MRHLIASLATAALFLGFGCKVSSQPSVVPLKSPACVAGQSVVAGSSGWTCFDPNSVSYGSVPYAFHAADAGSADWARFAADAGSADTAKQVVIPSGVALGTLFNPVDNLELGHGSLLLDGHPVPKERWALFSSPTGVLVTEQFDSEDSEPVQLVAKGTISSSAPFPPGNLGCTIQLIAEDAGTPLAETTVYPFTTDGGIDATASFILGASEQLPGARNQVNIDVRLSPTGSNICTATAGMLETEEL